MPSNSSSTRPGNRVPGTSCSATIAIGTLLTAVLLWSQGGLWSHEFTSDAESTQELLKKVMCTESQKEVAVGVG
jgi:hypothetical protein